VRSELWFWGRGLFGLGVEFVEEGRAVGADFFGGDGRKTKVEGGGGVIDYLLLIIDYLGCAVRKGYLGGLWI